MNLDTRSTLLIGLMAGEAYGLELIERIHEQTQGAVQLLQGRVYPVLRELEKEGLVKSYETEPLPERGGRPRRYYRITAEGRRAAEQDRKALTSILRIGWSTL